MTVTKITGIICSEGASAWRPRNLEHRPIICPEIVPIICLVGNPYPIIWHFLWLFALLGPIIICLLDHCCRKRREFLILFPERTSQAIGGIKKRKRERCPKEKKKLTYCLMLKRITSLETLFQLFALWEFFQLFETCVVPTRPNLLLATHRLLSAYIVVLFFVFGLLAGVLEVYIFFSSRFPPLCVAGACVHVCLERSNGFNWWTRMGYGNLRALAVGDCW